MTMNDARSLIAVLALVGFMIPCGTMIAQTESGNATPEATHPAAIQQFENEVRPILVEHCQSCHGAKKQELGLRLDSAKGLRAGSDNGAVVISGNVEKSSLIEAVRYRGDLQMPPRGKLSDAEIASLEKWVQAGAVWPAEDGPVASPQILMEAAKQHWSFQPIGQPEIPPVKAHDRVRTSVDAFILSKLESAGISLSPNVDRRTYIRRATFDLHGLPPTPDEVDQFVNDPSDEAFPDLIDRLLGSPRYGERWGRHWLDVARYADTRGYVRLNENPRFPSSWTYRDYVIQAFNDDLPFDRFILEQLAADLLPADHSHTEEHLQSLAGLGFLTLGQRFLNSTPDIIDDRIDVVSRGLLGMSVSCARCHDHKFDPVSIREYYGLYGVFMNSVEPREPPLILPISKHPEYADYLTELKSRTEQFEEYLRTQHGALTTSMRARAGEYLLAGQFDPVQPNFLAVMFLIDAKKDLNPVMTQRWARHLDQSKKHHDPVLVPWHKMAEWVNQQKQRSNSSTAELPDQTHAAGEFGSHAQDLFRHWQADASPSERVNRVVLNALVKGAPQSLEDAAKIYGDQLQKAEQHWQEVMKANPQATQLDDPDWEELRQLMLGKQSPLTLSIEDVEEFLFVDATTQQKLHAEQRKVTDWIGSPGAAPHAMALEDVANPVDSRVFIRGNASNPGEVAPRRFLSVLSQGEPRPFSDGSGRLELARSIASADNPLTARVIANRVWLHHFGAGLVRTPSDFGLRGERPTHPELLDYLATQLISHGWSIKSLHRLIMLSDTYRSQCSSTDEHTEQLVGAVDPENTLWSHMNRRRLDWESLRDSLLFVSGQLDGTMGGPSVALFQSPFSSRRTVYGLVDRQILASELRTFDFALPDASSPQRHQTTVPQQALFLMNSPFLKQQVRSLAARLNALPDSTLPQRIDMAYQLLFGRMASDAERNTGLSYLSAPATADQESTVDETSDYLSPWEEYLQALLLSNEFIFVD